MNDWFNSFEKLCSPSDSQIFSGNSENDKIKFKNEEEAIEELCHLVGDDSNEVGNQNDTQENNRDIIKEISNIQSNPIQDNTSQFRLKDPPDVDEILTTEESSISATAHNVGIINSACQQVLKEMEHQLLALLKKNRKEQEVVLSYLNTNGKCKYTDSIRKTNLSCLGMPYFRDSQAFPPPPNKDVLRKIKNNKLLPVEFIRGPSCWNNADAKKLTRAVNTIVSEDLNNHKKIDPDKIDWMRIAATFLDGKYSASECKSNWMINLRPEINKGKWSLREYKNLNIIAKKLNYQNWDEVAKLLGTNRSGFQCCVKYQTRKPSKCGKWSDEESEALLRLVEKYRIRDYIPWPKVTWHFERRSLRQCQEKYQYHLIDIKKGSFTMEEDYVLVYLAAKLKNFGEVAKYLPKRVSPQLRSRFEYLVNLTMPDFTKEEDELLTKLMMQYPRNWSKISENFNNRSKLQCRRRWGELQKSVMLDTDVHSDGSDEDVTQGIPCSGKPETSEMLKGLMDASNIKRNLGVISMCSDGSTRNNVKYPEVYDRLVEYYKYCYKFLFGPKCRNITGSEEAVKLSKEMKMVMSTLFVDSGGPLPSFKIDTLSNNCDFDEEDIAILSEIAKSQHSGQGTEGDEGILTRNKVIPPNYTTLVGMRTLTLAWGKVRGFSSCYKEPPPERYDQQIDPNERMLFTDAKKLFKSRLKSLFALPLVLSNISQGDIDGKPIYKPKIKKYVRPMSKLKMREKARMMSRAYRMKQKMEKNLKLDGDDHWDVKEGPTRGRPRKRKISVAEQIGESAEASGESLSADVSKMRPRSCKTGSNSEMNGPGACKRRRTKGNFK